ncbi:complex I subunit 5 family protein [Trujillonella humicola]|uniref:complex I subunit 5 family protein n=1 Tax=Trujillonella humicola TaxID=3383699 RepID=UPI0039063A4F
MTGLVPLVLLATSLVTAALIFPMREEQRRARSVLNLTGATAKLVVIAAVAGPVLAGERFTWSSPLLPGVDLLLRIDELSLLFLTLSALLWLVTTVYAIGYLEDSPHRSRFFGFFSLCVTSTVGIALAGNLVTFLIFYELLTLVTYPLVAHRGTPEALAGARTYLRYTLGGGAVLLVGVAWLTSLAGSASFAPGGAAEVAALVAERPATMTALFAVLVAGLSVKAAVVPLHGWLPRAMVAPAPVSALLHAVAVVKAGAFGMVRLIYDVYGIEVAAGLGVLTPLAALAAVTILYGSVRALTQDDLKKRLAYSTVSQMSYIVLGLSLVGVYSTTAAVAHLVHQGLMKITLFFCAGAIAETLHLHKVSELRGVGRRMPLTMTAFTIGALGMMGAPPVAGYVTKVYLGLGGLEAGHWWVLAVLAASTLLNAAYFLPILLTAWFRAPEPPAATAAPPDPPGPARPGPGSRRLEGSAMLILPSAATALLALGAGLLAGADQSPLGVATRIAEQGYP